MKIVCGIFVLFAVVLTATADDSSSGSGEIGEFVIEQSKICQKELKTSDKDLNDMLEGVVPTTKIAKCLFSCLYNKLGVVNDANKLVAEKLSKIVADDSIKSKDGKPIKAFIKEIGEACKSITDPDKCEAGIKIVSCLNAESKKRGFENNVF